MFPRPTFVSGLDAGVVEAAGIEPAQDSPGETEIAWAAGVFEGEGSISIARSHWPGSKRISVRFTMSMTDKDVVDRFHAIVGCGTVGGPYWHSGSTKPQWSFRASRREHVLRLAEFFEPYFGQRRSAKLQECLAAYAAQPSKRNHQAEKTHCPRGHAYTKENVYLVADGRRRCLVCELARWRRRYKSSEVHPEQLGIEP